MSGRAYSVLADKFEYLNQDCGYDSWSQYLYERLLRLGIERGAGLDIGCGSGAFTRRFAARGYAMTGFDASAPMLARAEELSRGQANRPLYVQADVRRMRVPRRADFALCVNDCLNYVPPRHLAAAFSHMAGCLRAGGALLFDVSSPQKLREQLGNNTFCEDREDLAYLWFNRLYEDRVEMEITLFVRGEDGKFERGEEHHTQYIHEESALAEAARQAGFRIEESGAIPFGGSFGSRIGFVCVREGRKA